MAGLGAKKFVDTEVLYAADVNGYLMEQSIMRFATTTARDAAFGGATELLLAEGMTCYIDADNSLYSYTGSAWVKIVSSSTPPGLELTKVQTFTNQSQVDVADCFNDLCANYKVIINITGVSGNTGIFVRMRTGSTTNQNSNYLWGGLISYSGSAILSAINSAGLATDWKVGDEDTTYFPNLPITFDILGPKLTAPTSFFASGFTPVNPNPYYRQVGGTMSVTTQYESMSLLTNSGSFTMSGTVRVYGYRTS